MNNQSERMLKVSVVILNWNGKALLEKFLPSVIRYSRKNEYEVVVADNGSSDDSVEMLKHSFPSVRIIELTENFGFAEGYNKALDQIDSEYCMLLNSDVEVNENWLEPLVAYMDEHPEVAATGPKILDYKDKTKFEYAGAAGGFLDTIGYPFCRGRIFETIEEDEGQFDTIADVLWVSGCALMARTETYKKEGGLDGRFFAHMEEIDLCWRLKNRGYRVVCIPESVIYHVGGASLAAGNPKKTFLNFRNSLFCIYKNLPEDEFFFTYLKRVVLDMAAAFKFLFTDGVANFNAVLQAHQEFNRKKKDFKKDRRESIKKMKVYDIKELFPNSVVWTYYIKNWKRFSDYSS